MNDEFGVTLGTRENNWTIVHKIFGTEIWLWISKKYTRCIRWYYQRGDMRDILLKLDTTISMKMDFYNFYFLSEISPAQIFQKPTNLKIEGCSITSCREYYRGPE